MNPPKNGTLTLDSIPNIKVLNQNLPIMNSNINEKVILGMLLVDSSVFPRYNTKLSVRLFFESKDHQIIFEIINSLWQNNKPVDMMIVIMELEK